MSFTLQIISLVQVFESTYLRSFGTFSVSDEAGNAHNNQFSLNDDIEVEAECLRRDIDGGKRLL